MLVVHSRDNEAVNMAHEPKSEPKFTQEMMGQYWLHTFKSIQNAFKNLIQTF